jgi:hypothetical protein
MQIFLKYRVSLFIQIFFLFLVFSCNGSRQSESSGDEASSENTARIEFNEEEFDFGTIQSGERVSHTFAFENTGDVNLIIKNARASCGCTIPKYSKDPIPPEGKGTIEVSFNSLGRRGNQHKTISIFSNAQNKIKVLCFSQWKKALWGI